MRAASVATCLAACGLTGGDGSAGRDIGSEPVPTQSEAALRHETWDVCRLAGPQTQDPGVYGTDLGYTVPKPSAGEGQGGELAILFGDTWSEAADACQYPTRPNDDLQAALPASRPEVLGAGAPAPDAAEACSSLRYPLRDPEEPTSWPPMRLFEDAGERAEETQLPMGILRTPVAAFSDGEHVLGIFHRNDPAYCEATSDCPSEMVCSADAGYQRKEIGQCAQPLGLSADAEATFCLDSSDCPAGMPCNEATRGICLAERLFEVQTAQGPLAPGWYRDDPRLGMARTMYIASAQWPERPSDYAVGHRFRTHRFVNVTARGIAHFDPDNPENNDYRQGTHTLLLWGRPHFATTGGWHALPFLLYQPLDGLVDEQGNIDWDPRFFAGYEDDGSPRWTSQESEAMPIYGTEHELVRVDGEQRLEWKRPEFDYVNQMGLSWVQPLQRWVMLYGGGVPPWQLVDPATLQVPEPEHPQPEPGAIHMRSAAHPWGRARRNAPSEEAWTAPQPVLTRRAAAPYLACADEESERAAGCVEEGDMYSPDDLEATLQGLVSQGSLGEGLDVAGACLAGDVALEVQNEIAGGSQGHLYGANIIDAWTRALPGDGGADAGTAARGAEIYWNVSTWNPYQVVLMKTRLRAPAASPR